MDGASTGLGCSDSIIQVDVLAAQHSFGLAATALLPSIQNWSGSFVWLQLQFAQKFLAPWIKSGFLKS